MKDSITLKVDYPHPIEKVWKALTDKTAMSSWLMPCDIEAVVGHKFQFTTKSYPGFDGKVHCEILEAIENEKLSFSWRGGSLSNTRVSFLLKKNGEYTTLYFEHSGFKGFFNQLIVKRILASGWKSKILTVELLNYLKA